MRVYVGEENEFWRLYKRKAPFGTVMIPGKAVVVAGEGVALLAADPPRPSPWAGPLGVRGWAMSPRGHHGDRAFLQSRLGRVLVGGRSGCPDSGAEGPSDTECAGSDKSNSAGSSLQWGWAGPAGTGPAVVGTQ